MLWPLWAFEIKKKMSDETIVNGSHIFFTIEYCYLADLLCFICRYYF